jgi:hypothetical protein
MNAAEHLTATQTGYLPGLLGFTWIEARMALVRGRLTVERRHPAPTGYLHAARLDRAACKVGGDREA